MYSQPPSALPIIDNHTDRYAAPAISEAPLDGKMCVRGVERDHTRMLGLDQDWQHTKANAVGKHHNEEGGKGHGRNVVSR